MSDLKTEFSQVYDNNIEKIYRFAFLKTGSKEVAEEISSETFLKSWKHFKKNEGNNRIDNTQAFLYKIAKNLITDYFRKNKKFKIIPVEEVVLSGNVDNHKQAEINSDFNNAKTVLATMKEDYQQVVLLRHVEGMSIPEIACIMKKSEGATRVILCRALEELKEKFNGIEEA